MSPRLSERLSAIADLVTPDLVLADIGCDHAHLPIALCASGQTPRAIASDLREGPLAIAQKNIEQAGLADHIETRRSDGFSAYAPGEVETAVLAGMGGYLICELLHRGEEVLRSLQELILAPQSDVDAVRRTAQCLGFRIAEERMVLEEEKFYPIFRLTPGEDSPYSEAEALFGPQLLAAQDSNLHIYLLHRRETLLAVAEQLQGAKSESALARLEEVRQEIKAIDVALQRYR